MSGNRYTACPQCYKRHDPASQCRNVMCKCGAPRWDHLNGYGRCYNYSANSCCELFELDEASLVTICGNCLRQVRECEFIPGKYEHVDTGLDCCWQHDHRSPIATPLTRPEALCLSK